MCLQRTLVAFALAAVFSGAFASTSLAHEAVGVAGGLVSGFMHPILGMDHVVAMVAVGLWGAFLGMPALWILPIVFPMVMALGGALGLVGFPLPYIETGIAASAVVLGLMVALEARPPTFIAAIIVGAFAIFHGYAHGAELPHAADAMAFSIGFVVSTGLMHLAGIAIGLLVKWRSGLLFVRGSGAAIAAVGVYFLVS